MSLPAQVRRAYLEEIDYIRSIELEDRIGGAAFANSNLKAFEKTRSAVVSFIESARDLRDPVERQEENRRALRGQYAYKEAPKNG